MDVASRDNKKGNKKEEEIINHNGVITRALSGQSNNLGDECSMIFRCGAAVLFVARRQKFTDHHFNRLKQSLTHTRTLKYPNLERRPMVVKRSV